MPMIPHQAAYSIADLDTRTGCAEICASEKPLGIYHIDTHPFFIILDTILMTQLLWICCVLML